MDAYADCFAGLLRALRIERAHLAGISFGGALVLAAFHRHRGLASSLTLVSGYAGWLGWSAGTRGIEVGAVAEGIAADARRVVAAMGSSMFSPSAAAGSWLRSSTASVPSTERFPGDGAAPGPAHGCRGRRSDTPALCRPRCLCPVSVGEWRHGSVPHSELVVIADPATPSRWGPRTRSPRAAALPALGGAGGSVTAAASPLVGLDARGDPGLVPDRLGRHVDASVWSEPRYRSNSRANQRSCVTAIRCPRTRRGPPRAPRR